MISCGDLSCDFYHKFLQIWIVLGWRLVQFQEKSGFEVESEELWAAQVSQLLVEFADVPCVHDVCR